MKESVLLFNGEIKDNKTLIESIKGKKDEKMSQNSNQIQVDLYAPCVRRFYIKLNIMCFYFCHFFFTLNMILGASEHEQIVRNIGLYRRTKMFWYFVLRRLPAQ